MSLHNHTPTYQPPGTQRSKTISDGTNGLLAKFYPIFWCGSFLYDKNEYESKKYDAPMNDLKIEKLRLP